MGDGERLRQFAKGNPDADAASGRSFPGLRKDRLTALADYLVNDDLVHNRLPKIELEDFAPDLQAPFYLLEYLQDKTSCSSDIDPKLLTGSFLSRAETADVISMMHLTIEAPADQDGLAEVYVLEELFGLDPENGRILGELTHPENVKRYKGWAVITGEENIVMFLKDDANAANQHMLSLAIDDQVFEGKAMTRFAGVWHSNVISFGVDEMTIGAADYREAVASHLIDQIRSFERDPHDD